MPQLLRERTVTARKRHQCRTCPAHIEPGQRYTRRTYVYDGRVYDWWTCKPCAEIATDVWEWAYAADEGVGPDEYAEWAAENHAVDSRAADLLARLGRDTTAVLDTVTDEKGQAHG